MWKTNPLWAAPVVLIAGCSTPSYYSPVEVTRFTSAPADTIPRGVISVQPARGENAGDLVYSAYRDALEKELRGAGYEIGGADAPYVALVELDRLVLEPGQQRRGPVSVGGGASTGTFGSGVGLGVGINLTPPDPNRIDTQLAVSIRPAGGGDAIWEGRANFTATVNNEFADPRTAAQRVAGALFEGFPGNSGETIAIE